MDKHLALPSIPQANLLSRQKVLDILNGISKLKAGVIGDGCLDLYWNVDMTKSELSRETPHYTFPVIKEEYKPGAAGNVAANLKALGCKEVYFCTVIGNDWRGMLLRKRLDSLNINCDYLLTDDERTTPAYCKPILHGLQKVQQEAPRIDFINTTSLTGLRTKQLIANLDKMAEIVDVIGVTDQLLYGVVSSAVRERLKYWSKQGKIIVADSRERIGLFENVIVKPNEIEAMRSMHSQIEDVELSTWEDWIEAGCRLSKNASSPCCITLGEKGALWIEQENVVFIPTIEVEPPYDIVGAGDSFTSSLLSALGAGYSGPEAVAFSHLAASVSVKKIGEAGNATPEEIMARFDVTNEIGSGLKSISS